MEMQFPTTPIFAHPPIPFIQCIQNNFKSSFPCSVSQIENTAEATPATDESLVSDNDSTIAHEGTCQIVSGSANVFPIASSVDASNYVASCQSKIVHCQPSDSRRLPTNSCADNISVKNIIPLAGRTKISLTKCSADKRKSYSCNICQKILTSAWGLKVHVKSHSKEKPFKCTICSYTSVTKSALVKHCRKHTGEKPHCCTRCNKSFKSSHSLKLHIQLHTGKKSYECHICGKEYIQKIGMSNHIKIHERKKLNVDIAKNVDDHSRIIQQFDSHLPSNLCTEKIHTLSQRRDEKHPQGVKCQYCSDNILFELMDDHICNNHADNLIRCDHCAFICVFKEDLVSHLIVHFTDLTSYPCLTCGLHFSSYSEKELHVPIHFIKNYEFSGQNFTVQHRLDDFHRNNMSSNENLNRRILFSKVINNVDALTCQLCHKQSADARCLKIHMKIHYNKQVIKCTECPMKFWYKSEYLRHSEEHKLLCVPYCCRKCSKCFQTEIKQLKHMYNCCRLKCYKSYNCTECHHSAFSLKSLIYHIKIVHHYLQYCSTNEPPQINSVNKKRRRQNHSVSLSDLILDKSNDWTDYLKCTICEKYFSSTKQFNAHWELYCRDKCSDPILSVSVVPNKDHVFICSQCSLSYNSKQDLLDHDVRAHLISNNTLFKCRICSKLFVEAKCCFDHYIDTHSYDVDVMTGLECDQLITDTLTTKEHLGSFSGEANSADYEIINIGGVFYNIYGNSEYSQITEWAVIFSDNVTQFFTPLNDSFYCYDSCNASTRGSVVTNIRREKKKWKLNC